MGTPLPSRTSSSTSISGLRSSPMTALPSPSSANQRNMRSVLSDKYIIGEELGRGAYGQVFKGIDTRTGDCVAIKQLSLSGISNANLQSIMLEIELLKNLNHKNIVKYVGSFKTRTHLYIILEFMENGSLASVIKPSKFGAFPESLVATYISQVLQGLAYLHQQGVVHRDIKGANILTTKEGIVKLADFGVAAKLTDVEDGGDNMRISVVGTPYWMAPEMIEMTSVTAASDIWSVGCLAIELLTGSPPYFEHAPMSALFRIVQDEHPPLPPDISADMADFLLSCFHKNPQRRAEASALLRHRWILNHRQTLRASWTRTQGLKARSARTDAHATVATVVERILQLESGPDPSMAAASQDVEAKAPAAGASNKSWAPSLQHTQDRSGEDAAEPPYRMAHDRAGDSASEMSSMPPMQQRLNHEIAEAPDPLGRKGRPPALDKSIIDAASTSSVSTPTPASEAGANSLSALLHQLAAPTHPPCDQHGEDLVAWLEKQERATKPLQLQSTLASPVEAYPDGAASRHQEAAEVRRLAASLRPPSSKGPTAGTGSSGGMSARETTVIDVCQQLVATLRAQPEHKAVFVGEDGIAALMELLEERTPKVALAGLELANALVAGDEQFLDALCLAGALPLVCRLALHTWPRAIRLQAALFLQQCCQAGRPTATMLVACQGLPMLVGLIEDSFAENGHLTTIGVGCIWRILEMNVHGGSLNHLCRLLSCGGLPHRLARALSAVNSEYTYAVSQEGPTNGAGFGESPAGALRKYASASSLLASDASAGPNHVEDQSRLASHLQASTSAVAAASRASGLKYGRPPASPGLGMAFKAGSGKAGNQHRRTTSGGANASVELLYRLLEKMTNLLLLLSHGDSTVKGWICRRETLVLVLETMRTLELGPLLILFRCFKNLTSDPSMLQPLQDAGTIPALLPYLSYQDSQTLQLEALRAIYNLCRISRTRQEAAAVAGIIPRLTALAVLQPAPKGSEGDEAQQLRYLAVSLLCGMAHSTQRTRAELWAHNGLELLLQLLKEEEWQSPALDALAIWLSEDPSRIEARLAHRDAIQRFVVLFSCYTGPGNNEALDRLLDPFLRILRRSRKVCMELGSGGLAPLVVEMLRHSNALTALRLLQMVHHLYEQQPRPKEFITQHPIAQQLRHMASADESVSVLVQKQAQNLLNAFQINSVF